MPLTPLITFVGSIIFFITWLITGRRIKKSNSRVSKQVRLLHRFFAYMSVFFFLMFIPQIWLGIDRSLFPDLMAWGYTVGHIFLYLGLMEVARLTVSMIPRLASKENWVIAVALILNVAITIATYITMVQGTQPTYSFESNVTLYNAAPVVGISIALFAAIAVIPASVMMFINGVRNPRVRVRSFLLGAGLTIMMIAGPAHDLAETGVVYMIADIITIISVLIMFSGILYRFEERIAPATEAKETSPAAY